MEREAHASAGTKIELERDLWQHSPNLISLTHGQF